MEPFMELRVENALAASGVSSSEPRSEADDGPDGRLNESIGHRLREDVDRLPSRAVGWRNAADLCSHKGVDRWTDDRLEDPAGEVRRSPHRRGSNRRR